MKNRWLILAVYAALAAWAIGRSFTRPSTRFPTLAKTRSSSLPSGRAQSAGSGRPDYLSAHGEPARLPHVRTVRSASAFGFSMVMYLEDSVDITLRERVCWSGSACKQLPALRRNADDGSGRNRRRPGLLVHGRGPYDSGTLHSIQDWFIKYQLNSVPGVAEVASVGGFVKQYQIDLDPSS